MSMKSRLALSVLLLFMLIAAVGVIGYQHLVGELRWVMLALAVSMAALVVGMWVLTERAVSRPLAQAVVLARQVASGDLTVRIATDGKGELGNLLQALRTMIENLTRMVSDIRISAEAIHTAAQEVAVGNANLSQRTEQQASTLEQTASSMEQLTTAVRDNTESARKANALSKSANAVAAHGGEVVNEVVITMNQIQESSRKIADIISVIDSIAFQTNILALNAAVEAARAGEQGRGFAVVAAEVRSLAQRSADAAKEIKDLIGRSVERVDAGTRLVENAGKTMSEIVESVARVTNIIDQITTASSEQSAGIEQVNQAINQMEQVLQQNAAVVEQATAAAESMRGQAELLTQVTGVFKLSEEQASRLNRRRDPARDVKAMATDSVPMRPPQKEWDAPPVQSTRQGSPAALAHKPPAVEDGEWKEF